MNGREWVVEAFGCDPGRLCNSAVLQALFDAMIAELSLHPVSDAQWHTFPPPGGVTGVCMLAESHLTVHTFPEHASLCLNLFCCTPREPWDWTAKLAEHMGATAVHVRVLEREYAEREHAERDSAERDSAESDSAERDAVQHNSAKYDSEEPEHAESVMPSAAQ